MEHTPSWFEFGLQFREIIRDRPTNSIPDDHDVGHGNLWGENGHQGNAHLRGTKADIWEGGHRVPFVVRWPGNPFQPK